MLIGGRRCFCVIECPTVRLESFDEQFQTLYKRSKLTDFGVFFVRCSTACKRFVLTFQHPTLHNFQTKTVYGNRFCQVMSVTISQAYLYRTTIKLFNM